MTVFLYGFTVDVGYLTVLDLEGGDNFILRIFHYLISLVVLSLRHRPLLYRGQFFRFVRVHVILLSKRLEIRVEVSPDNYFVLWQHCPQISETLLQLLNLLLIFDFFGAEMGSNQYNVVQTHEGGAA